MAAIVAFAVVVETYGREAPNRRPEDARRLFLHGDYEAALATARMGRSDDPRDPDWWRVEAETLMMLGRYEEAHEVVVEGMDSTRSNLRLHLIGIETAYFSQSLEDAERFSTELRYLVMSRRRYMRSVQMLVDYGEAALVLGAEPKLVLENFLKRGRESSPPVRDAFLVTGKLALEKHDDALASRTFQQGIAAFPEDPDMWAGLAASFLDGDRTRLIEYATQALEFNPAHVPSLLLLAEHAIDAQNPEAAQLTLNEIATINPRHPKALAFAAVLAHLDEDIAKAGELRTEALSSWEANPLVDHTIGRKLSHHYRFREGAEYQRSALALDPHFAPARMQLAQDLLRLGRENEGWQHAERAHELDAYDVAAYNLVTLQDRIEGYTTLETPHIRLRMGAEEAPIYGQRALAFLEDARNRLTERYGIILDEQITVEIHPNPKDFAVRTFGMPDNPGFLGVCFGPVVTINSPATRNANWEAVLWHEFAHVITLTMTKNKMPRWLSEGISVFEEHMANPTWRRVMSLDDRDRILSGQMKPISGMSAAFLEAEGSEDLQFAYFQSGLVVDFLVQDYGFEHLRLLLTDLGRGMPINEAFANHFAPLETLDEEFRDFARGLANDLGGEWELARPTSAAAAALSMLSPRHFHGRMDEAKAALAGGRLEEAREILNAFDESGLYLPGDDNIHVMLAEVSRTLGDTHAEKDALETIIDHEADALEPVTRLLALAYEAEDAAAMARWADAWLAINPLAQTPWRAQFAANEKLDNPAEAIAAGKVLLELDTPDRASIHHRIARMLEADDPIGARRHVLLALEEAPRFQAAHQFLAKLHKLPQPEEAHLFVPSP